MLPSGHGEVDVDTRGHWEHLYGSTKSESHSWHQPHLRQSLALIAEAQLAKDARLVDIGGGDSTLVDDLLEEGYVNVTVVDISRSAMDQAKNRLGALASRVHWVQGDVTKAEFPPDGFDLWHDRALFHFLTANESRAAYLALLRSSLRSGGYAVMATFSEKGPEECSGISTTRYSEKALAEQLGASFHLVDSREEVHRKPQGGEQQFIYCLFRKS